MSNAEAVIKFWFEAHGGRDWWGADPAFDREIAAAACSDGTWTRGRWAQPCRGSEVVVEEVFA